MEGNRSCSRRDDNSSASEMHLRRPSKLADGTLVYANNYGWENFDESKEGELKAKDIPHG